MTLNESISDVRQHLMEPRPDSPQLRQVMLKLQDCAQLLHLEAQNTSTAWDIATTEIVTVADQADYALTAADLGFGKDVRIITIDPGQPYHVQREIRRCDLQDIDQFYSGPARALSLGHSASVIAFYRQQGQVYAKLIPTPAEGGNRYEVWYETDMPQMASVGDSPTMTPFQRYRNIKAAIALIPYCDWNLGPEQTTGRMSAMALSLQMQHEEFKRAWQNYIANDRQDGTTMRIGYAEHYYDWY